MSRFADEDAAIAADHSISGGPVVTSYDHAQTVSRWRDLREMLIRQLAMFETGDLTLRSNDVNVSQAAMADLKRSILEFDALISAEG